jgi:hypothetical protein
VPFGFSLHEIVWQRVDNYVIAGKLAPRGQDTVCNWLLADNGEFEGFVQQAAPKYSLVNIPSEKLLHYRFRPERNNPEGRSILRSSWLPYYYAKNIMQIEAIGIERDLAGMPMIQMPEGADTNESDANSDYSKAAQMVRNIRNDEQAGVVIPFGWTFSLVSSGGSRQFDTDKIVSRYESRMLMSALAQFLMLGQNGVGSFSLSRDQTDLFTMAVNSIADIITEVLQTQLLPRLMKLNGYDAEGLKLSHSPAGDADIEALSNFLQKVGNMITWTVTDEMWLRQTAGLPEVDADTLEDERDMNRQMIQAARQAQQAATTERTETPETDAPDMEEEPEPEDDPEEQEDMNAGVLDFFTSDRPADVQRRRNEGKLQRALAATFSKIKRKLVGKAKEMRGG